MIFEFAWMKFPCLDLFSHISFYHILYLYSDKPYYEVRELSLTYMDLPWYVDLDMCVYI